MSSDFTWFHLGQGLVGAAVGGAIEAVGIGLSTLVNTPRVTYRVVRALWRTETFGPVLKTTLTPTALVAGFLAPAVGVLAGAGVGIFHGFVASVESITSLFSAPARDVHKYHTELVDDAIESLEESAMEPPTRVYEIRVIEAIRGLITGSVGAVITSVLVALATLVCMPGLVVFCLRVVFEGGNLPIMVALLVLVAAALVLGPALAVVLSVIFGLGVGAYRGYSKGLTAGVSGAFEDAGRYYDALCKVAYK